MDVITLKEWRESGSLANVPFSIIRVFTLEQLKAYHPHEEEKLMTFMRGTARAYAEGRAVELLDMGEYSLFAGLETIRSGKIVATVECSGDPQVIVGCVARVIND